MHGEKNDNKKQNFHRYFIVDMRDSPISFAFVSHFSCNHNIYIQIMITTKGIVHKRCIDNEKRHNILVYNMHLYMTVFIYRRTFGYIFEIQYNEI
jgi:uncharacterized membrane protein